MKDLVSFKKVIDEIRPGWINLQSSLIDLYFSEKGLRWDTKIWDINSKKRPSLVCELKGEGDQEILLCKLLLGKCNQALLKLTSWIKKKSAIRNLNYKIQSLRCEQIFSWKYLHH